VRSPPTHRTVATAALLLLAACGGADVRATAPGPAGAPVVATLASPAGPGAEKLRGGDLAGARASYEAALAQDPSRLAPLNDLAVSYVLDGHGDAARRLLDEVVASGSVAEQQAALVNLGELFASEGYVAAAQAYLETARGLDPARPEPHYALALLADARGDLPAARAALREAQRRDEGGAARASLAYVYPEERVHLDALVAEAAGDLATARERWRSLAAGRYAALAAAAERHLAGE
jgi:Tfp pilus assembly protein PilF